MAQRHLTLFEFDAAGRLIHTTTGIAIGDFDENHPEFDEHPDLADLLDPDSGLRNDDARQDTFYEYDAAGRQTAVVTTQIDNPNYDAQNPNGEPERIHLRSETVYADFGRRDATREGITQTSVFQADTIDRMYQRETNFEYDTAGNLTAVILRAVLHPQTQQMVRPRYEYSYDIYGNRLTIRDNVVDDNGVGDYDHDGVAGYDTRVTEFATRLCFEAIKSYAT